MTYAIVGKNLEGKIVRISQVSRLEGLYILGSTGTGKSTLIESLILQDIKQQRGVCVLDPHGDLVNNVLARLGAQVGALKNARLSADERKKAEYLQKRLEEDVILLDLSDEERIFGLNLYECSEPNNIQAVQRTVNQVLHIFERLYAVSRATPQMLNYMRNCAYTIIANQGNTIADIPLLLRDAAFRKTLLANVKTPSVLDFWADFAKVEKNAYMYLQEVRPILNKLNEFGQPMQLNIFGQSRTTLDFERILDQRKIVLVKLALDLQDLTTLIGSTLIALILRAAYARRALPPNKRNGFHVYADEFQWFASEDFATLFVEARKYGIGLTIAHQVIQQQTDPKIKATCKQAANKIVFQVPHDTAKELAGEFHSLQQPRPAKYEMLRTPVMNPIDFMLSHGAHPGAATRQFMQLYGKPLVDRAKHEEIAALENHRAAARYEYGLAEQQTPAFLAPPPNLCRETLSNLNRLLHEAMRDGEAGKNPDEMTELLDNLIRAVVPEAQEFLVAWDTYSSLEDRSKDLFDLAPRKAALHKKLSLLPLYGHHPLLPIRQEFEEAQKEFEEAQEQLTNFMKAYLRDEARFIRSHFGIIRRGSLYYFISHGRYWADTPDEDSSPYEDSSYRILCEQRDQPEDPEKTAKDLLPPSSSFETSNSVPFASWEAATYFFWRQLQKNQVWFRAERYISDPKCWQYQRAMVTCERKDERYTAFSRPTVEELDVWLLQPGVEQHWYTADMLKKEVTKRLQDRAHKLHDPGIDYLEWITGQFRWSKSLIGARFLDLDQGLRTFTDAKNRLERATYAITEKIEQETEKIHHELNLIEIMEQQRNGYEAFVVELETLIRHMMAELAEAPIVDASGIMQESSVELPSLEVEARIANELNQQQKHQARVRRAEGETTIMTIPSTGVINDQELPTLIEGIKQRNVQAGYLRLRSDVEREIASRRQRPPDEPPSPASSPPDPSSPPPPPPMKRRKKVL